MQWSPKGHVGVFSASTPSTSREIDQRVPRCMEIGKQMMKSSPKRSRRCAFSIDTVDESKNRSQGSRCMAIYKEMHSALRKSYVKSISSMTMDGYGDNYTLVKVIYCVLCLSFDEAVSRGAYLSF